MFPRGSLHIVITRALLYEWNWPNNNNNNNNTTGMNCELSSVTVSPRAFCII